MGVISLPTGFSLVGKFPTNVATNDSIDLTVRIETGTPGTFSGMISFPNNAGADNPFNFMVTGKVLPTLMKPPEIKLLAGPALPLMIDGAAGTTYTIESTESLTAGTAWRAVKTITTGESWVPPMDPLNAFFRVRVQ